MRHSIVFAVAAAVSVLGGCASHRHGDVHSHGSMSALAVHMSPQITVRGDIISVGPEPLVFRKGDGSVSITWSLPPGFKFADNGIVIEGRIGEPGKPPVQATLAARAAGDSKQDQIVCPSKGEGRRFTCVNRNGEYGAFKYRINVIRDDGKLLTSDPSIMNIE
jgi:hypothetical protein